MQIKPLMLSLFVSLAACGPDLHLEGLGTEMSQTEIRAEIVGNLIAFTGRNSTNYTMTLKEDGVIDVARPRDSGVWFFSEETSDICLRFALYASGDTGCFGIAKLPEANNYVTDHGFLIEILRRSE